MNFIYEMLFLKLYLILDDGAVVFKEETDAFTCLHREELSLNYLGLQIREVLKEFALLALDDLRILRILDTSRA